MSEKAHILDTLGLAAINTGKLAGSISRYAVKKLPERGLLFWLNTLLVLGLFAIWSVRRTHLIVLHWIWPSLFSGNFLLWLSLKSWYCHFLILVTLYVMLNFYVLGFSYHAKAKRSERVFKKVGMHNAEGQYPQVVDYVTISPSRYAIKVLADAIAFENFDEKKSALESSFNAAIEEITRDDNPMFVHLRLSKQRLPREVFYRDLCREISGPYTFLVGKVMGRIETQDISTLPHILVAGSTGTGKSVFLKQLIMALVEEYEPNIPTGSEKRTGT